MAYTNAGIYYATNDTTLPTTDILQQFAESVSDRLNIVQVVGGETSTLVTTTAAYTPSNTTYTPSGLSATITPRFASSKILILATLPFAVGVDTDNVSGVGWSQASFELQKNSYYVSAFFSGISGIGWTYTSEIVFNESLSVSHTDQPNTILPTTYSIGGLIANRTPAAVTQYLRMNYSQGAAAKSSMILMEALAEPVQNSTIITMGV
jgi:hypothetical protein